MDNRKFQDNPGENLDYPMENQDNSSGNWENSGITGKTPKVGRGRWGEAKTAPNCLLNHHYWGLKATREI